MSKGVPPLLAARIALHTAKNLYLKRPLCIALEVTHNCTANCRHCDKGPKVEDNPVGAQEYRRICRLLSPSLIQIAGGEPLKRADLAEIVTALHRPNRWPFLVLITNASLLTVEKYLELREAGIRQFSISLDFPDERHDDFRRVPGLYRRLGVLIPRLLSYGNGDVVINTCITRTNYPYLLDIARKVGEWGAKLNFSAYTDLRTHDPSFNLSHPEDTTRLATIIDEMFSNGLYSSVMTSRKVLQRYCKFYERLRMPNCRTGYRFLIVNPDGRLTPCAMFIDRRFNTRQELIEQYVRSNECDGCYISMRANTEKSAWELLTDNLRFFKLSRSSAARSAKSEPAPI